MGWLDRLFSRRPGLATAHVADPTDAPLPKAPLRFPERPERTYRVKRGDTLESIARDVFGSASHAQRLAEANRERLGDPPVLYPGQELRVR